MGLLYRLLGLVSAVNAVLGAIRIYWLRLNWIALALLVWASFDAARQLAELRPAWVLARDQIVPIARMTLSTAALVLFVVCLMRQNIIFRVAALPLANGSMVRADSDGRRWATDLRFSGKVRRGGASLPLRDFPVALNVAETGEISLEASVEVVGESPDIYSLGEDRSGMWSVPVSRESLKDGLEEGVLYWGLSTRPALRLTNPGTREVMILSFPNAVELRAFLDTLDDVVAESARNEAIFSTRLTDVASQPSPAKKPEGDVKWDDLIDFSS